mmetsp:Transcript_36604/g.49536  ORF Transcript_36604/g.49536 Transcript_36604/m.49536 type:complete len:136 (-) Transcript_36604:193-600(-)
MAIHMNKLLEASQDSALSFVVIVPAWSQCYGLKLLSESSFLRHQMTLPQNEHGYCEGKQQLRNSRFRIASFDTAVFWLQNDAASVRWPVTDVAMQDLREAFKVRGDGKSDKQHDKEAAGGKKISTSTQKKRKLGK